jgi:hypothetical protein
MKVWLLLQLVKVATACDCLPLKQVHLTPIVPAGGLAAPGGPALYISLLRTLHQFIISTSLSHIPNCSILFLVPVLVRQKWGPCSSSVLPSSIPNDLRFDNMINPIPGDRAFFVEWPTWARLAIVRADMLLSVGSLTDLFTRFWVARWCV